MPELPEVETIKLGLQKTIIGKKIARVEILRKKSFEGNPEEIVGKYVVGVERRAKLLIIGLEDGKDCQIVPAQSWSALGRKLLNCQIFLVIHLKMTGQIIISNIKNKRLIRPKDKKNPYNIDGLPNKYIRVVISFEDGSKLFFNDLRVFGWIKIIKNLKLKIKNFDEVIGEKFGPEPFSKEFTVDYLKKILGNWGRPVKLMLIDQTKLAGIGNIYSNEALFCVGIAPHHRGRDLLKDHPEKIKKLYDCILKSLKLGIKYGGSTALDDAYRNIEGERGQMQKHFMVYGRDGEDCPNKCGKKIRKMKLGGRGTFFCPRCQR